MTDTADSLFTVLEDLNPRVELVGGKMPVLLVDGIFRHPEAVRDSALRLRFDPPPYPYPGGIAQIPALHTSIEALKTLVLDLVNRHYLPRIPTIRKDGEPIHALTQAMADFAVVDVHPDNLSDVQRTPHVDAVPIFGLIYLNRVERGGTLFFSPRHARAPSSPREGYLTGSNEDFDLIGGIEGRWNRLAIYPGFVPHSGEIGEWIRGEERNQAPRLTLRLPLFA